MNSKYISRLLLLFIASASISFMNCSEAKEPADGIGTSIPDFFANNDEGNVWNLKSHLGSNYLVVYFYPAAMTGGCTLQACSYRDNSDALHKLNAEVVGISGDSVNNIRLFKEVYELNFTLLSDINGEIAGMFGVPLKEGGTFTSSIGGQNLSLERAYTTSRWTFVLDRDGKIIYKNTDVNAENDSGAVITFLKTLK